MHCFANFITALKSSTYMDPLKCNLIRHLSCTWWRHQMETFSALLALCAGNSPVTGKFPAQRPVTRSVDVFFDLRLNKRLSKQSRGWWFEKIWGRRKFCHLHPKFTKWQHTIQIVTKISLQWRHVHSVNEEYAHRQSSHQKDYGKCKYMRIF